MTFSDFPFPWTPPRYPDCAHITRYLEAYVKHWGLQHMIKFGHNVLEAMPTSEGRQPQWLVRWQRTGDGVVLHQEFDALVVAAGAFVHPSTLHKFSKKIPWRHAPMMGPPWTGISKKNDEDT